MADLLLELFSEEIPARMQADAADELQRLFEREMQEQGLACVAAAAYVTPRRLALHATGIPSIQADATVERKGPKVSAPPAAIEGFLRSTGLSLEQLEKRPVGKDEVYFALIHQKGRPAADLLKEIIERILTGFPWPKSMRWGAHEVRWVRPLHSILCLFEGMVVPVRFGPVEAGNVSYGHRFLSAGAIPIRLPEEYAPKLREAFVVADAGQRRDQIRAQANEAAAAKGLHVRADEALLAEVTGLVEWPVVLIGGIDERFMDLPPEVLTAVMRTHQKYFALQQPDGALAPYFLTVANMETKDRGASIVAGNERVLRARFADARFFWDQDRKTKLEDWGKTLSGVTFHARLGSVADKVERVTALALTLADMIEENARQAGNFKNSVERAAQLCKADLVTGMVGEFAELQGVMGRYYALAQGENPAVADAIRDHYKPLGPSDTLPTHPVSICVALADKIDTLASLFAIGEKPTGSRDPFALRRAALGVIRIVLENEVRLSLRSVIAAALQQSHIHQVLKNQRDLMEIDVEKELDEIQSDLLSFFSDRLKIQLKEQGVRHDLIAAVFALGEDDLVRLVARVRALQSFLGTEDGTNLLAAYKRAANILAIEEKKDSKKYSGPVDATLLKAPEEIALYKAITSAKIDLELGLKNEDTTYTMQRFSELRAPVDTFFDKVLVNDSHPDIRANRLNLLSQLRGTLDTVANFALIEG